MIMAATDIMDDRPSSPAMAIGAFEMKEESKEFSRSLAISTSPSHHETDTPAVQDGEIHDSIINPTSEDASSNSLDTLTPSQDLPSSDDLNQTSGEVSSNSNAQQDLASPDEPALGKRFIAPKDFELLKVIGMGAFGKV